MNEIYKPVTGYEGLYEVSNLGRVRSLKFGGRVRNTPRVLQPTKRVDGNLHTFLTKDGERRDSYIHRLVAEAFIGPIGPGMYVCHNNGNPSDNRLENLRVDTPRANQADRVKHGTSKHGKPNPRKLTKIDAMQIKAVLETGTLSQREMAECLGVAPETISAVATGKTWKRVNLEALGV